MAKHTFIISDEAALNSYGFRVLTKGIRFNYYNTNPLVLWMHKRPKPYNDENNKEKEIFPIGLAYDLRFKGGQLLADIEFDQNDEFARTIEKKVESGHIRMASPGLEPVTWSDDIKYMMPGQKFATLVESELTEISIVDIGSNPMALKLYNSNKEVIELSAGNYSNIIPLAKPQKTTNKSMEFLQQVAVLLGKEPDAAQDSVLKTLQQRLELAAQADGLKVKLTALEGEVTGIRDSAIVKLVDSNIDKKITADKKDFYVTLGKSSGIEVLNGILEQLPEMRKPSQSLQFSKNPASKEEGAEPEVKTFSDLKKQGIKAVELCKSETPEEYIRLFKAEYGFEPKIENE